MELVEGYPDYMQKSLEAVERTRTERLHQIYPLMSLDERENLLKSYHPDYIAKYKRPLRIGVNRGDLVPIEVAELLEAEPWINESDIDLKTIDYDPDVLIIGGGGAGTVAALWAVYSGLKPEQLLIATKLRHGDSNSMMAQGGIQAADRPDDSPLIHYLDAFGGGHFTNKPELVKVLTAEAPQIIKWHESLGIMYDKDDEGNMLELSGGGTSKFRLHSAKDYTGMELMRTLRDEARNLEIPVVEFAPAVELITDENRQVAGAVLYNMETSQYLVVKAKVTILATGGFGRLHIQNYPTTNHYGATADGLVLAYRVGAKLRDLDAVQYHPTGAAYPEQIVGLLITEKVRGLGGQPLNKQGEQFVNPLEPRDVESAAIIRECYARDNGVITPTGMRGVWLDTPLIELLHGSGTVRKSLSAMYRMYKRFGIDIARQPILVFPTLHYQNGGVEINQDTETTVRGLLAAGEVTGGVHGKNRLMGNSLLDFNVFGRRAGIHAVKLVHKFKPPEKLTLKHVTEFRNLLSASNIKPERKSPLILPDYRGREVLSRAIDIL